MADAESASSTNLDTTLYHNPNCSKSRSALELLTRLSAEQNFDLEVVEYLNAPLDRDTLERLLTKLPNAPTDMVRRDKNFKALGLDAANYQSTTQVIELLLEHPQLMQRPVAIVGTKAVTKAAIGRPPEDLLELYS